MSALEEAMTEQRVVRIRYTSRVGSTTTRDVEPVTFAYVHGRWHLVGWCRLRDAMRWFLVSRIEDANATTTPCGNHSLHELGIPPATARPVHRERRAQHGE